jgi:hypothetical protein
VKTNQAGPQQSFDDLRPPGPRQQSKHLVGGKWNVQKETDGHPRKTCPHQTRQQKKMIVMNPQDVLRLQHFSQGVGERAVDALVFLPMLLFELRQHREIMEERPKGAIAKAEIKTIYAFFRQKDRRGLEFFLAKLPHGRLLLHRDAGPRPSHPQILELFVRVRARAVQVTPQPGRQPARAGGKPRLAVVEGHRER